MRIDLDAWDPSYGTGMSEEAGAASPTSSATIDPGVEIPEDRWAPVDPAPQRRRPSRVLLVDGVRRVDGQLWATDDHQVTHPGIAASYAAGVVRCDLGQGAAEVAVSTVRRGWYTSADQATDLVEGSVRYPVRPVGSDDPGDLSQALQRDLAALEKEVSLAAREQHRGVGDAGPAGPGDPDGDLLVVDGPLYGRTHLPRTLGYIKTHRAGYLPNALTPVVTGLRPGQRCPVFQLGTTWDRYTWYLRLPGAGGSPWAGIVRVECSADLSVREAVDLAGLSAATLPRFASAPYKDPRAPQNLVPIAGLERRLRSLLGDSRLLHRALAHAARRTHSPGPGLQ